MSKQLQTFCRFSFFIGLLFFGVTTIHAQQHSLGVAPQVETHNAREHVPIQQLSQSSMVVPGSIYFLDISVDRFGHSPLPGPWTPTIVNPSSSDFIAADDFDSAGNLFGLDFTNTTLVEMDPLTGTVSLVGPLTNIMPSHSVTGLSWNPVNGNWYATSTNIAETTLYSVDILTGTLTVIGTDTNFDGGIWIDIDNNGVCYAADIITDQLATIDLTTGIATLIGPIGFNVNFAQDADFDAATNTLYTYIVPLNNNIYSIDTGTGAATAEYAAPGQGQISMFSISNGVTACPTADVKLTSQAEVDAFPMLYPDCTDLPVGLVIRSQNGPITDLSPLSQLESIDGHLVVFQNPQLTSLSGLENIQSVTDVVAVNRNPMLADLSGLSGLETAGSLQVYKLALLTDLDGLSSLQNLGDDLVIRLNPNLTSCAIDAVCDHIDVGGTSEIIDNGMGCNSVMEVEEECNEPVCPVMEVKLTSQAQIDAFPAMYPNCVDFPVTIRIVEDVRGNIKDLTPLSQLESIDGDLIVYRNRGLQNLNGLENITSVSGTVTLNRLARLQCLGGLSGLETAGELQVYRLNMVTDLNGLSSLTTIDDNLVIRLNNNLSDCAIDAVCDYINTGGTRQILDNGMGCNSVMEVQSDCGMVVRTHEDLSDVFTEGGKPQQVDVFPNPTSNFITIQDVELKGSSATVTVIDSFGQRVAINDSWNQKGDQITIDVSGLRAGNYYIQIEDDEGTYVSSFTKM